MKRHFDEEMNKLKTDLLKMATLAETSIYKSIEALNKRDAALAEELIVEDKRIDELELMIEESAIDLLATRQPLASDLRFITTGMKINAELERIGDLSVNIAQRTKELMDKPLLKPLIDIPKLSEVARKMVKGAIDSFVNTNEELAKEVILTDPEADRLRNLIYKELIDDYMCIDGKTAPRAVPLLLVARHLERICDHATYIAEFVIYMIKAENVKHHPEKLQES